MKMSNKLYDFLKDFCLIYLPSLSIFYVAIAEIWGFPCAVQIAGTVDALCILLGSCLKISNNNYKKENTEIPEEE